MMFKQFKRAPRFVITLYMKSGNVIVLRDVLSFTANTIEGNISKLEWKFATDLQLLDITLSQIEAITSVPQ